jgi:hypothetical protein
MNDLSTGEWIAIIGVVVAVLFGFIQVLKSNAAKSGKLDVNQSSGPFSKGNQKIDIKVEQNDK